MEFLAMSVNDLHQKPQAVATRERGTRFPGYDLKTCIEVPRLIHVKGGGQATPDQLAAHLGYKGTNNGAYLTKVASAIAFGLISKTGPVYVPTPLAYSILSPTYPHDAKKAAVDAFMNVSLFKKIFEDFRGKELPPGFGMKNALKLTYGVAPNRVDDAYKSLMDSAETAGLFETKNGARTHLILPLTQPVPSAGAANHANDKKTDDLGGSGNGGGDDGGHSLAKPRNDDGIGNAKEKYLSALIKLFEERSAEGELDEKLMERIERLLGAQS